MTDWAGGECHPQSGRGRPLGRCPATLTGRALGKVASASPAPAAPAAAEVWVRSIPPEWLPRLREVALEKDFVDFMELDGVVLPPLPATLTMRIRDPRNVAPDEEGGSIVYSDDGEDHDTARSEVEQPPPLEELQLAIEAAIDELGGMVVPRLGGAIPYDAAWMNGGDLECGSSGEVLTLLKASDEVSNTLGPAGADSPSGPTPRLFLIAASDFPTSNQASFRAFLGASGLLRGVSQRPAHHFFPEWVGKEPRIRSVAARICDKVRIHGSPLSESECVLGWVPFGQGCLISLFGFAPRKLCGRGVDKCICTEAIVAVWCLLVGVWSGVTCVSCAGVVDFCICPGGVPRVIDIQRWDHNTDPLLFIDEELRDADGVPVRVLPEDADEEQVQRRLAERMATAAMPIEMLHLMAEATGAGSREENIAALIEAVKREESKR
jgi:hypothetical protein